MQDSNHSCQGIIINHGHKNLVQLQLHVHAHVYQTILEIADNYIFQEIATCYALTLNHDV